MNLGNFFLITLAIAAVFNLTALNLELYQIPYEPEKIEDARLKERIDLVSTRLETGQLYDHDLLELHKDENLRDVNWHVSSSMGEQAIRDLREIAKTVIRKASIYNSESNGRVDVYLYDDFNELSQKLVGNGMDQNRANELIIKLKKLGGVYLYYENLILINPLSLDNHNLFLHVFGHELTHHYQKRYCSKPNWFSEGFAEFVSFNAIAEKSPVYVKNYFNRIIYQDFNGTNLKELEESEILDRDGYEISFLAVSYLLSNFRGNYYENCNYDTSVNWKGHFAATFGLTPEEFYKKFEKAKFERIN